MITAVVFSTLLLAASGESPASADRPALVTGELYAPSAQPVLAPAITEGAQVIQYLPTDGTPIKKGDTVLRVDPGQGNAAIASLRTQKAQIAARTQKEIADLLVSEVGAQIAVVDATARLRKAELDAKIPTTFLSELTADQYRSELAKAGAALAEAEALLRAASAAVTRKREDAAFEQEKLDAQYNSALELVKLAETKADRDGIFVAGFNYLGRRFAPGETTFMGDIVGQVVNDHDLAIRAFANEFDRQAFAENMDVDVRVDAFPALAFTSKIQRISGAPETRKMWGSSRYYTIYLQVPKGVQAPFLPGMSVLISDKPLAPPKKNHAATGELVFEGELEAKDTQLIAPPSITDQWRFRIAALAPEGTTVNPGDMVAVFEIDTLADTIAEKTNQRNEKQSLIKKLLLDHNERNRQSMLAVKEAEARLERARQLASQPEALISRVAYSKFVIDAEQAERNLELVTKQASLERTSRNFEMEQAQSEHELLDKQLGELEAGQAALTVLSDRAGTVMYQSNWNGEKLSVGTDVGTGQLVAMVGDTSELRARILVPEVYATLAVPGAKFRVEVSGTTVTIPATVIQTGKAFRAKSSTDPNLILDVVASLDAPPSNLKIGSAIRAVLVTAKKAPSQ